MTDLHGQRLADISEDRKYRYVLRYCWDRSKRELWWVLCNPSIADDQRDDPTTRKIKQFTNNWGYGGYILVNVYAYRTPRPEDLALAKKRGIDLFGDKNEHWLTLPAFRKVVVGWGDSILSTGDGERTIKLIESVGAQTYCLGKTRLGNPRHPLWVERTHELEPYP